MDQNQDLKKMCGSRCSQRKRRKAKNSWAKQHIKGLEKG